MTFKASFKGLILAGVLVGLVIPSVLGQSPVRPNSPTTNNPPLISNNADYTQLRNLLEKQQWRKANELTRDLLLQATNRQEQGWFSPEDINKLACQDLATLDRLWRNYSNNRFGFSVQYGIFVETGNKPGRLLASESYDQFGDRVGWREDNQWISFIENLDYSLNAPVGHLPNPRSEYEITGSRLNFTALTQRLVDCKMVAAPTNAQPTLPSNLKN